MDGKIITNFIVLRPTMYCLKVCNEKKARVQKEWKSEMQNQHREVLNALTALELAVTKSRTMAEENVAVPTVQMYEGQPPSTMGPGPPPAAPAAPPSVRDQRIRSQCAAVPEPAFPPAPAPTTYGATVGGVPKLKVKRDLDMKDYEATLHEHTPKNVNFNAIRSKKHQIYSINQSKVGLTSYDKQRYWFNDTDSLPYEHYSLSN